MNKAGLKFRTELFITVGTVINNVKNREFQLAMMDLYPASHHVYEVIHNFVTNIKYRKR